MQDTESDVLVVGGGASGLAAALTAAEHGAKVVLIEQGERLGGMTALAIGSITATGTPHQARAGITDSPQEHFDALGLLAGCWAERDNLRLRRILVEHVPETFDWLLQQGLRFHGPLCEPPHPKPRMHTVIPSARAYIDVLSANARRLGVRIMTSTRAKCLSTSNGQVEGAVVSKNGGDVRLRARRAVILASGDYSANAELKARYAPKWAGVPPICSGSTGEGHLMCEQLGATIVNGEVVPGPRLRFAPPANQHWISALPTRPQITRIMAVALRYMPEALLRPLIISWATTFLAPDARLFSEGAILVNGEGKPFADEVYPAVRQLAAQPSARAFIVFDSALRDKFSAWPWFVSTAPVVGYAYMGDYRRARPDLYHEAPSVEALASKLHLQRDCLQLSIDQRRQSRIQTGTLSTPPFAALGPVGAWTVITNGGISVTENHQVERKDGTVIPGLYAAGSVGQGGLLLEGHGHTLAWAFTSGRRAGRHAVIRS